MAPKENVRPVRKVQLDKPRGSRLLHHSKLGSSPPLTTPSKLLFMEPRYQRDTSAKMALSERKHKNLEQISNSSKVEETERKINVAKDSSINSDLHKRFTNYQENPFISEDFQPTPVVKYLKSEFPDTGEGYRKRNDPSVLSPLTHSRTHEPARVDEYTHQENTTGRNRDFYRQNFCGNPFFETPVEHNRSSKRKLLENGREGSFFHSKRSLFDDSKLLGKKEERLCGKDFSSNIARNKFSNSNFWINEPQFRSRENDSFIMNSKAQPIKQKNSGTSDGLFYKENCKIPLDNLEDKGKQTFSSSSNDFHPKISEMSKKDRYIFCTPKNQGTLKARDEYMRSIPLVKIPDPAESNRDGEQSPDNSFEVNKHDIHDRDEMSLLITSTPLNIARKPTKLVTEGGKPMEVEISPIGNPVELTPTGKPVEKEIHSFPCQMKVRDYPVCKTAELVISPIGKPAEEMKQLSRAMPQPPRKLNISQDVDETNLSVTDGLSPTCDSQVPDNTMVLDKTAEENHFQADQSISERKTHPSETEIVEILAEMNQLEDDQVKEWELSVYYSQTRKEKEDEEQYIQLKKLNDISDSFESVLKENDKAIKLENFIENEYDALSVLKAVAAKLEIYVKGCQDSDQVLDSRDNPCENAESFVNPCDERTKTKVQTDFKSSLEKTPVRPRSLSSMSFKEKTDAADDRTRNADICSTTIANYESPRNSDILEERQTDVTLTAPQITVDMESSHQMSPSCTNDMKCKCRDSFVLRSSRETQTEMAVRSTGVETERISAVSVGIQCDLFLDGCDCKLEAPGSQDSFHSVASNFNPEIPAPNGKKEENEGYQLRSRKNI